MAIFRLATAIQNSLANQITAALDAGAAGGTIKIYDGSEPSTANTAVSTQNLLATLTFLKPSFGSASGGVIVANPIAGVTGSITGSATWARIADSNGNTIFDCDVGASSSATIALNTTNVTAGGSVVINSFTITVPAGA